MRRPRDRAPRRFQLPWRSRDVIQSEVDEEIAFHHDMRVDDLIRSGMDPEEARAQARREFGDVRAATHALRAADEALEHKRQRGAWLDEVRQDLRYSLRAFGRDPVFTVVAVLTLAIGIGATAAIATVVDGVLLRPLPVQDQDRLVVVRKELQDDDSQVPFNHSDFRALLEQSRAFERVGGIQHDGPWPVAAVVGDQPVTLMATTISHEFFQVLGIRPVSGRLPLPEDAAEGAEPTAVISHDLWRRLFGADPEVEGRRIRLLAGIDARVVGVAPAGLEHPHGAEAWLLIPRSAERLADRSYSPFSLIGRLRPGASIEQASAEVADFIQRREALYEPAEPRGQRAVLLPFTDAVVGEVRPALLSLLAAVGLVLLIASVNVATLLLIRSSRRERELAVRGALGAGRGRIVRQLVTENVVLAALGGALGMVWAYAALRGMLALAPADLPRLEEVSPDGRVLAFTLLASIIVVAVLGITPALGATKTNLYSSLRSGQRAGPERRAARRSKEVLAVGQMAMALVVVAEAGLLTRSLLRLQTVDVGFDVPRLTTIGIAPPPEMRTADGREVLAFFERLVERVEALPGIEGATPVILAPFSGAAAGDARYTAEGQGVDDAAGNPGANLAAALPNYFTTMGIPIRNGRPFNGFDREGSAPVVIVSEQLARRMWPGEDAIGQRIKLGGTESQEPWRTVVGVAGEVRYQDLVEAPPGLYVPFRQAQQEANYLAVRAAPGTQGVVEMVRRVVADLDPRVMVVEAEPVSLQRNRQIAGPRFHAVLLQGFGAIALLLAALGLYGVMASLVAQRTREIGIRMALGATAGHVHRAILRHGLLLAITGAGLGTAGALVAARGLRSVLFEVSSADPMTLVAVVGILLTTAALASYIPARRATKIDPQAALRAE